MAKVKLHKVTPINYREEMREDEMHFPQIHIREQDLPDVSDWEVGEDYMLTVRVTQKSKNERLGGEVEASFDIKEIGGEAVKGKKDDT